MTPGIIRGECNHSNFTTIGKCDDCCLEIQIDSKAMKKDYFEQGLRKSIRLIEKEIKRLNEDE